MKKRNINPNIIGFIFVSVIGTINHFVYEWSGENVIAGLFSPINESSWEHLKLIFFPYLIWAIIQYFLFGKSKGLVFSKVIGVLSGMLVTLIIFYTYSGIIGKNIDWINILSFFIGVLTAFVIDNSMQKSKLFTDSYYTIFGLIITLLLITMFIMFTFIPPLIPLFKDPLNSTYGI